MSDILEGHKCPICEARLATTNSGNFFCTNSDCGLMTATLSTKEVQKLTKNAESLAAAKSAHREASETAARILHNLETLNEAVSTVIDELCHDGRPLKANWEQLCLLVGRYCEPFLSHFKYSPDSAVPPCGDSSCMGCSECWGGDKRQETKPNSGEWCENTDCYAWVAPNACDSVTCSARIDTRLKEDTDAV